MMSFNDKKPLLAEGVFVATGAQVIGEVSIGRDSSVFYNSVIRGDINSITIGEETNIQDNCTLHVTSDDCLQVGNGVTVGHNVILHGCVVGDNVMVGMGAIVLDGACIQADSIVAAGSLVPPGKDYPPGTLIMGSPARVARVLTDEEKEKNRSIARKYIGVKNSHLAELQRVEGNRG